MTEQKEKKKFPWGAIAYYGVCVLIGIGIAMALEHKQIIFDMTDALWFGAAFVISMFLHIILHEAGHMLFGLLTGYRFVSFRVASFMWEKQKDGKIRFSRFSLAGTGGQCLMAPPEYDAGNFPFRLYNLGGGLMNFMLAAVSGLLLIAVNGNKAVTFLIVFMLSGIILGAVNLIPLKKFNNDGSNLVEIGKSPAAKRAFWLQMRINQETANGVRLKDMPEEWFVPQTENRKNIMVSSLDVLAANRLMDGMQLEAAEDKMRGLMRENCLAGVYKCLLTFELSFLEILRGDAGTYTEKTGSKENTAFAKAMKKFPSILRWRYAKALLLDKDATAAKKAMDDFEKMSATYPHPCEIEGERALLEMVNKKTDEKSL